MFSSYKSSEKDFYLSNIKPQLGRIQDELRHQRLEHDAILRLLRKILIDKNLKDQANQIYQEAVLEEFSEKDDSTDGN